MKISSTRGGGGRSCHYQPHRPAVITIMSSVVWLCLLLSRPSSCTTDAFAPKTTTRTLSRFRLPFISSRLQQKNKHAETASSSSSSSSSSLLASTSSSSTATAPYASIETVATKPIAGMKPGTSGLRKKVEIWQGLVDPDVNRNYVPNFIQSLLDTAVDFANGQVPDTIIVAGDGRYYNDAAMQIIVRVLAGNGVRNIYIPQTGIMSTPAVSAAIRANDHCHGGIILTASHNPGGPGEDFGIKYNLQFGQPAGEDFTDALYERSLKISSFQTIVWDHGEEKDDAQIVDLNAPVGSTFPLTSTCTVTIIDPFQDYVKVLKQCFDFYKLKAFAARPTFSLLFDGMHGAGGPFARRVLIDELGMSADKTLMRCNPLPDFGQGHPDPNLSYAAQLVQKMGLLPDGSANPDIDLSTLPTLGAANDGDGDRNLIAGAGCFVTPSDSLAVICDQWQAIPHFCTSPTGPRGVARSMPSSAALDVVAKARGIPCFSTPTGWKFFGNLMSSKELFDKTDYTPFLCGEESFGTGSDHIREKDGLWAALAWMSILAKANEQTPVDAPLVSVRDIVKKHWATYGRHFYCRYDYENVDSDAANKVMDLIRNQFVTGTIQDEVDDKGIQLVDAEEFSYTDPVDGSKATNQGLILQFLVKGDPARVVFRLSGTGSAGATIRMYLEKFEQDVNKHDESAPNALLDLANRAVQLVHMQELTGRDAPTVIT